MLYDHFDHADTALARQATPTGMHRSDLGTLHIAQQDGQTVRHHHRAGQSAHGGIRTIGLGAIRRVGSQLQHLRAMHLIQKHRSRRQRLLQDRSIAHNLRRIITNVGSQIQAVKGRH